jgi:hypothetical protein
MKNILIFIFILISVILWKEYSAEYIDENFNKPKKTIILVIARDVKGISGYWGLGDIIRGMISTYQIAKKLNYEFIIDIQLHPISKYLIDNNHKYSQLILDNKDNIKYVYDVDVNDYIINHESDVIYFNSNNNHIEKMTDDCKEYIKHILTPNDKMVKYINKMNKLIPYESYNILHYRLGDDEIVENKVVSYDEFINNFKLYNEPNDILMSDSVNFKKLIKPISDIYMFDLDIGHVGIEDDDMKIMNTLYEYYVITKAQKIKSYSTYDWPSGFMTMTGLLYDIPFINLKFFFWLTKTTNIILITILIIKVCYDIITTL